MVTVKQFLDAGFKFVVDDVLALSNNQKATYDLTPADLSAIEEGQERYSDDFVIDLAWRKNTGVQPVGGDCWVEVLYSDGENDLAWANAFRWEDKDLTHGKPSLKHLEQQMTDNQETKTALEMSERDMCDAVESEWVNGDECVYVNDKETIYTYVGMHPHGDGHYIFNDEKGITYVANGCLYEPETPEQKAARERMESAYDLYVTFKDSNGITGYPDFDKWKETQPTHSWLAVVDKTGYHKQ